MRNFVLILAGLFSVLLSGCGGSNPDSMFAARFDTKMKKLAMLYTTYQTRNDWTGPEDETTFREYIKSISDKRLQRLEITQDDVDGLFVSERDGQPYLFRWSMVGGNGVPPKPILFEAEGVDGNYMVCFTNGISEEFSKADYDILWSGGGDDGAMINFEGGQRQ
ncbi:MAG: hypothetical protein AAGA30_19060 [Planctomycetota bacterium]